MKYKIGDKVKILRGCRANHCREKCPFIGLTGTIKYIERNGEFGVKDFATMGDQHCSGFTKECFEIMEQIIKQYQIAIWCKNMYK